MSKYYIGVDTYFVRDTEVFNYMIFTVEDGVTKVIRSGTEKDQYKTDSELKFNENCFRLSKYYEDAPVFTDEGIWVIPSKEIYLCREDLNKENKDKPIEDIWIYDFKESKMSKTQMEQAWKIVFVDGEDTKILKNRS